MTLSALSANLAPSLDLLGDIVQRPAFDPAELERVRTQTLTAIAQPQKDPNGIAAARASGVALRRRASLCDAAGGDAAAIGRFTRDDLVGFQERWLRPDNMKIFVVSDRPLAEIQPLIEAQFGNWAAPAVAGGRQAVHCPAGPADQRQDRADRPAGFAAVGDRRRAS